MKIEKNYNNLINAWSIATSGLETIKETLFDNAECNDDVKEAYYIILQRLNKWNDEIKKLQF